MENIGEIKLLGVSTEQLYKILNELRDMEYKVVFERDGKFNIYREDSEKPESSPPTERTLPSRSPPMTKPNSKSKLKKGITDVLGGGKELSYAEIQEALKKKGITVSPDQIRRCLSNMKYNFHTVERVRSGVWRLKKTEEDVPPKRKYQHKKGKIQKEEPQNPYDFVVLVNFLEKVNTWDVPAFTIEEFEQSNCVDKGKESGVFVQLQEWSPLVKKLKKSHGILCYHFKKDGAEAVGVEIENKRGKNEST